MKRLNLLLLCLLTALIAPACGTVDEGGDSGNLTGPALGETSEGIGGAATSTYFLVTGRDARRCAFPRCGGFYVKRVNLPGGPGYVAEIDYSALGIDGDPLSHLQEQIESGKGLLRGRIVPRTLGGTSYRALVASEAWISSSGPRPPAGIFHRLQNNGIVCITTPCFSVHAARLNRPFSSDVSDVDLSPSGAPQEEIDRANEALGTTVGGILAAGHIRTIPNAGAGGAGRTFFASQFYLKVAPQD